MQHLILSHYVLFHIFATRGITVDCRYAEKNSRVVEICLQIETVEVACVQQPRSKSIWKITYWVRFCKICHA